jgi:hypothetical protein
MLLSTARLSLRQLVTCLGGARNLLIEPLVSALMDLGRGLLAGHQWKWRWCQVAGWQCVRPDCCSCAWVALGTDREQRPGNHLGGGRHVAH